MLLKEQLIAINKFNMPAELEDSYAKAIFVVRLIMMEPGYLPSSPGAGVGLQTKWRFCDTERLSDLKSVIQKQILEFIPELFMVDLDIYYEKKVLIIKVISKTETYVFGTENFEELTILDII